MFDKIKNKKGVISINYVILIFVCFLIILGFMSIMRKTLSINEIQGNLDMAGIVALREGVDETRWRLEQLVINESVVRNKFTNVINSHIKTGKLLKDFKIVELNIYPPDYSGLKGLGIPYGTQSQDQYFIESVAVAEYKREPIVDLITSHVINYFDFFHTNKPAIKMVSSSKNSNNVKVIIRSVSRFVYR